MPPVASMVIGRSIILPFDVMVLVPEVAAKVMAVALPAGIVMPLAIVKLPLMVLGNVGPVPENPVKSKLRQLVTFVNVMVPEPAEIQMLGNPVKEAPLMVLPVEEVSVVLTVAVVAVRVNPAPERSKTVPVPVTVQVPVPILRVLVPEPPLGPNAEQVTFLLLASNVAGVSKLIVPVVLKSSAN